MTIEKFELAKTYIERIKGIEKELKKIEIINKVLTNTDDFETEFHLVVTQQDKGGLFNERTVAFATPFHNGTLQEAYKRCEADLKNFKAVLEQELQEL